MLTSRCTVALAVITALVRVAICADISIIVETSMIARGIVHITMLLRITVVDSLVVRVPARVMSVIINSSLLLYVPLVIHPWLLMIWRPLLLCVRVHLTLISMLQYVAHARLISWRSTAVWAL